MMDLNQSQDMQQGNKGLIVFIIICLIGVVGLVAYAYFGSRGDFGHAPTMKEYSLTQITPPQEATDIAWSVGGSLNPHTLLEFNCTEAAFHQWVKQVEPDKEFEGPYAETKSWVNTVNSDTGEISTREVYRLIQYAWTKNESSTHLYYDRDQKRAYFLSR